MLVEASIITLLGLAAWRATKPSPGIMTPKMRLVYQHALNKNNPPVSPERLLELADIFEKISLPTYADVLRKRAIVRSAPPHIKAARKAAYAKARTSTNPEAVLSAAEAFESMGMTGAAAFLRTRATALSAPAGMANGHDGRTADGIAMSEAFAAGPAIEPAGAAGAADQEALDEMAAPSVGAPAVGAPAMGAAPAMPVQPIRVTAPSVASGDGELDVAQDFKDFVNLGGPADLLAPPVNTSASNDMSPGPAPTAADAAEAAKVAAAEELAMTPEEYAQFMAGGATPANSSA